MRMSEITQEQLNLFYTMMACFKEHYSVLHDYDGDEIVDAIETLEVELPGEVCELPKEED